jgi:Domain of unknown function (DUF2383)
MLTPSLTGMMLDGTPVEPSAGVPDPAEPLARLHTRTIDALKGFVKMVENAQPDFRPVIQRFHDVHVRHADEISRLLTARGMTVDADGSFMGTVNETVIGLRAFFNEIDVEAMSSVRSGERHVLNAFDEVLEAGLEAHENVKIATMRADLVHLLHETRHLI